MIAQIPAAMAILAEVPAPPRPDSPAEGEGQAFERALRDDRSAGRGHDPSPAPDTDTRPAPKPRKREDKARQDDPEPAPTPPGPEARQTDSPSLDNDAGHIQVQDGGVDAAQPAPDAGPKSGSAPPPAAVTAATAIVGGKRGPAVAKADLAQLDLTGDSDLAPGEGASAMPVDQAPAAALVSTPLAGVTEVLAAQPGVLRPGAPTLVSGPLSRVRQAGGGDADPDKASSPMAIDLRGPDAPAPPVARPAVSQVASALIWQAAATPALEETLATAAATAATVVVVEPESATATHPAGAPRPTIKGAIPAVATSPQAVALSTQAAPVAAAPTLAGPDRPATAEALPQPFHPMVAAIAAQAAHPPAAKPGGSATELILHPAELGRIRFSLSGAGDQLTIAISAENRDTLALLQRHLPALQAELQREGLAQANLAFSGWGGDGAARQDAPASAPPGFWADGPADAPAVLPPDPRPAPLLGGGLDLRL